MLGSEQLHTFRDLAKICRASGAKVTYEKLWRWSTRGLRGVRLESRRLGRQYYSSVEAVDRFAERLADQGPSAASTSTSARRPIPSREEARRIADAAGF